MRVIRALLLATTLLAATPAHSQGQVCASLRQCVDILDRHGPDSFDYRVLAAEFARLRGGTRALERRLEDPDSAPDVLRLAARPTAAPALREAVFADWAARGPRAEPRLYLRIARDWNHPTVRRAAISTLGHPDAAIRRASNALLATQSGPYPGLADDLPRLLSAAPSAEVSALLAQDPTDRAIPGLQKGLRAADAPTILASYLALEARNPARAQADLDRAFRDAPAAFAPVWADALERAGRDSQSFDAIAHGYRTFRDTSLPDAKRAVGLHSALLYPAGDEGQAGDRGAVRGDITPLLPELARLPVSARLADTALTHPGLRNRAAAEALLSVWQGQEPETAARFARNLGKADVPGGRAILRGLFAKTTDYRVQVAVAEALGQLGVEDSDWLRRATQPHPIRAVREAGAEALGIRAPRRAKACFASGPPLARTPERLPFFTSGRTAQGDPAPRWQLVDAAPFPRGWLALYRDGVIRYGSDDTAERLPVEGRPMSVLPLLRPANGARASRFAVLTAGERVARLYVFDAQQGLSGASTLPMGARAVELGEGWAIAFPDRQDTLRVGPNGRILSICKPAPLEGRAGKRVKPGEGTGS